MPTSDLPVASSSNRFPSLNSLVESVERFQLRASATVSHRLIKARKRGSSCDMQAWFREIPRVVKLSFGL